MLLPRFLLCETEHQLNGVLGITEENNNNDENLLLNGVFVILKTRN